MKGTYDIAVDTPKRRRAGTLALDVNGQELAGRIEAGDLGTIEDTGTLDGDKLLFKGSCDIPDVGIVEYDAVGEVWGNSIEITAKTEYGKVEIRGTRTATTLGDFSGVSRTYSGRWSDPS